jgi:hypothetical protein
MLWKGSEETGAAANAKIKVLTMKMVVLKTIKDEAVRLNGNDIFCVFTIRNQ